MATEDPNDLERVLNRRAREKAIAQSRSRGIAQAVDPEGQVRVWNFASRRYQRLWPVDAAEGIAQGLAALEVIELVGPGGPQMVNVLDQELLRAEGWRRPGEEPGPVEILSPPAIGDNDPPPVPRGPADTEVPLDSGDTGGSSPAESHLGPGPTPPGEKAVPKRKGSKPQV